MAVVGGQLDVVSKPAALARPAGLRHLLAAAGGEGPACGVFAGTAFGLGVPALAAITIAAFAAAIDATAAATAASKAVLSASETAVASSMVNPLLVRYECDASGAPISFVARGDPDEAVVIHLATKAWWDVSGALCAGAAASGFG